MILGVDHGYGYTKTRHSILGSSVAILAVEPGVMTKVVKYNNKYYQVGNVPDAIIQDKTSDERYYVLTLAAIAEELKVRGKNRAEVSLAVGLPFTHYGKEKSAFVDYMKQNSHVDFEYEGNKYFVTINPQIYIYPQGLSSIISKFEQLADRNFNIVDIGTGTTEIIAVNNGISPDMTHSRTLSKGISNCVLNVNEALGSELGGSIPSQQIINIILNHNVTMPKKALEICKNTIADFADSLLADISNAGVNYVLTETYFVGGGAFLIQNYARNLNIEDTSMQFITDIKANAIGYEELAKNQAAQRGGK